MTKKQTRRAVGLSEASYQRLHVYAINTGTSKSAVLERIFGAFFKGEELHAFESKESEARSVPVERVGNIRFF